MWPDGANAAGPAALELSFERVTVTYASDEPPALVDCSFHVGAGERVALIGANGSGKTTVLSACVGLLPHRGRIRVGGAEVDRRRVAEIRERIGFLFSTPEDQLLFPRVVDDVAFTLTARRVPPAEARAAARETLAALGIEDIAERSPYRLSHGQRLRAALAGVLVSRPPLLLLDEPTSGLDPAGRRLLAHQLRERGPTLLLATHDLDFAGALCDRYILLDRGRVVGTGSSFEAVAL